MPEWLTNALSFGYAGFDVFFVLAGVVMVLSTRLDQDWRYSPPEGLLPARGPACCI